MSKRFKTISIYILMFIMMSLFANNAIFALNETYESVESIENDENERMIAYITEINNALKSVELPPKYNLPTLFVQPTMHPNDENDIFGKMNNEVPIFSVNVEGTDKSNYMCLTFDSAYINRCTYRILDILDEYNIKSTFFMTYEFMKKNPSHVMEIIKRGHEIGNHSTTHPDFNGLSDAGVVKEVMKTHNYIKDLVGVDMSLFRFPMGSYSPRTVTLLKNMGYYPIQWTLDSVDWKNISKEFLVNRIIGNDEVIVGGSIILFHNGATYTPDALPEIIEIIQNKNLKCVRVSDMIYDHNFHIEKGRQYKGKYVEVNE